MTKSYEIWGVTAWDAEAEEGDEAVELGSIEASSESEAKDAWLRAHRTDADDFETIYAVEQ